MNRFELDRIESNRIESNRKASKFRIDSIRFDSFQIFYSIIQLLNHSIHPIFTPLIRLINSFFLPSIHPSARERERTEEKKFVSEALPINNIHHTHKQCFDVRFIITEMSYFIILYYIISFFLLFYLFSNN